MKGKKKAFLLSFLSLLMCVSMFIGTTFAWFTDSVTSGVNKIVAGNLDVEVKYQKENGTQWTLLDGSTTLFSTDLWEPGHTEVIYLSVENVGTLSFNYKVLVTPVSENGGVNVNGKSFKLSEHLVFGTTYPTNTEWKYGSREAARAAITDEKGLDQSSLTQDGTIKASDANKVKYMALVVYMPESVGNEANYKKGTEAPTIELGIKVVATQLTDESDSFGNDYDNGAVNDSFYTAGAYYDYFPQVMASAEVVQNGNTIITANGKLNSTDTTETTLAKVTVPVAAVATGATNLTVKVVPKAPAAATTTGTALVTEINDPERETANFDIKVEGVASGNTADIKVEVFVGKGLANVKVYHNGALISGTTYNDLTGIVTFTTTSFSDYTVAYDVAVAAIGTQTYGSLENALKAAQTDETVVLLKDETVADYITINEKNITLDLNSHDVVSNSNYVFKIYNANFHITGTGTIFENVKDGYAPILAKGSDIDVANYTVITIDKGVTLKGDYAGIFVARDEADTYKNYGLVVNMYGTIDMSAVTDGYHYSGLYVNGQNKVTEGNVMQINLDGVTIKGCEGSGIYAAGYAKWNITNSNITGVATAIEIRAGELNINGGNYTATTENAGSAPNGNGSTTNGAAIAIAQHTTKLPISVNIADGTFNGVNALIEANPQNNSAEDVAKISIAISDGTFNGAISSEDVTGFITGGKFSNDPSEYCAEGYYAFESDGMYLIDTIKVAKIGETYYTSLSAAIAEANNDDTIVLIEDSVSGGLTINSKNITIELNGKTLNINASDGFMVYNAKLTLQDSSAEKTGTINHVGSWDLADVSSSATLAITSGTYTSTGSYGILYVGNGSSEITGGRFNQEVACASGYETEEVEGWYIPVRVYYWSDSASENYATEIDVTNKVVTIASAEELALFANEVNNGNNYKGYTVYLANDIDLAGKRWTPISGFAGTFDGGDHTIKNLEIKLPDTWYVGFFAKCASGAKIQNVIFENANVQGGHCSAIVNGGSGGSEASFSNVTVKGDIQLRGGWYVGVILGKGYSQVDNCHVIASQDSAIICNGGYAGGIVGFMGEGNHKISNCSVENMFIESCWNGIGGISGILHYGNTITNCVVKNTIVHQNETDPDEIGRAAMIAGTYLTSENQTETLTNCQFIGGRVYDDTADYTGTAWIGGPWGGYQPDVGTVVVENNTYIES